MTSFADDQQTSIGISKSTGVSLGVLVGFCTVAFVIVLVTLSKDKHKLL